jgi:uncharacterized protein (TIGR01777 family)
MKVLLAGASGLIGGALKQALLENGDTVHSLVRRAARSAEESEWQPASGQLDPSVLADVDAVVCLSGAGVGDHRWTDEFRNTIMTSRTSAVGTHARATAAARAAGAGPSVFISGSAVGYYGDRGDRGDKLLDEDSASGTGFFPDVGRAWEAAATPAADAGARVVNLRTGIVLAKNGPVLGRMVPLFKLGLGGRLGHGKQYWSWITLTDEVAAIGFLLTTEISGPTNLTAPTPVTNAEFTRQLAHALHRPALFPVPSFALHLVLGDLAGDILGSQRVVPGKLSDAGFVFSHPDLASGLRAELA